MSYVDGFVLAVRADNRDAFRTHAATASAVLKGLGAIRVVDCWGDDVPAGKVTDFRRAVKAEEDEIVVFSWVEWASKDARNAAWAAMMADPRTKDMNMPFDGSRMIFGGFQPMLDSGRPTGT